MLQRKFDHLSDLGYHRLQAADIFVDNRGNGSLRRLYGLRQELDISSFCDLDDSSRAGGDDSELDLAEAKGLSAQKAPEYLLEHGLPSHGIGRRFSDAGGGDDIASHERPAVEDLGEYISRSKYLHPLGDRSQGYVLGLAPGRQSDLYILADARSSIGSDKAIHPDHVGALILGIGTYSQRCSGPRAGYLDYIQRASAYFLQEFFAHPDYALSDIALICLRYLKPLGFSFRHISLTPAF